MTGNSVDGHKLNLVKFRVQLSYRWKALAEYCCTDVVSIGQKFPNTTIYIYIYIYNMRLVWQIGHAHFDCNKIFFDYWYHLETPC